MNGQRFTLLVKDGSFEMVKLLIANGADINAKNDDEWTPLHIASRYGSFEIVKLLVEKGARCECKN